MKQLFIDITELVTWKGELTGVPRVMNELVSRFEQSKDSNKYNVCFVTWNQQAKTLVQVKLLYKDLIVKDIHSQQQETPKSSNLEQLKRLIRRSKHLSHYVSIILTSVRHLNDTKYYDEQDEANIQDGDLLLILADWHSSDVNFIEYITKLHDEGIQLIQFVHDLIPIVTPQYASHATSYVTRYAKTIYPISDLFIVTSKNTKKDITQWMETQKFRKPKIEFVRLGDDFKMVDPLRPKAINAQYKPNNYILCVGTIESRKNHMLLYYVYKLAYKRNINLPKLIIVGRLGWHAEYIYETIKTDPEIKQKILILENINDNELAWLYKNALFSIYPSCYEGWGLPVAESIKQGKMCLSSDTSSLPEIAGELIEYFNPFSTDECLESIIRLSNPKVLKDTMKKLNQYKVTTWDETFKEVNDIIRKYEQ